MIASSVGTEWFRPFESNQDKERFNTYWKDSNYYTVGVADAKEEQYHWFGKNAASKNNNFIFPIYTTKYHPEKLPYSDQGIVTVPLNWDESLK